MEIKATIRTANGEKNKSFDVEVKGSARIYSPELVEWVESNKDRTSNYIWITAEGKTYMYSI